MITGRSAAAIFSTAAVSESCGGTISKGPMQPSGDDAAALSSTGRTWTSAGKIRWPTSRSTIAVFKASDMSSACLLFGSTVCENAATPLKAVA